MDDSTCPACNSPFAEGAQECPTCGVIFARWKGVRAQDEAPLPPEEGLFEAPHTSGTRPWSLLVIVAAVVVALVALGLLRHLSVRSADQAATEPLPERRSVFGDQVELPASVTNVVFNDDEAVCAVAQPPFGLIRVHSQEEGVEAVQVQVAVPGTTATQRFTALTFNGSAFAGCAAGPDGSGPTFTFHDPETLQVKQHSPAPAVIGGLAWDGAGYWAASGVQPDGETPFLFRLAPDLSVTGRYPPPGGGCRGLTWDGRFLWWADADGSLRALDTSQFPPRVELTTAADLGQLAGIGFDGHDLWLVEQGTSLMHRVKPQQRAAWLEAASPELTGELSAAELRRQLRSDDWSLRERAAEALRARQEPVDFSRHQESYPGPRTPFSVEIPDWWVEVRGNALVGGWTIYFGPRLFSGADPARRGERLQARYTVSVEGGRFEGVIEKEFEGSPGTSTLNDVPLAAPLGPGSFQVNLTVEVRFKDPYGQVRTLGHRAMHLDVETVPLLGPPDPMGPGPG